MLNLGRLQVLCEVVNRGSFSAAADALSYTQSAVSQAIARLEAETGAALVIRDRRGVRPTAAGATLVTHAESIFAQVDAAEAELAAVLGVRAGRLRVASFPSAGATLMPLAVAAFRQAHPDVALTLAEGEPEEIGPRLRAGEFDLALLFEFPGVQPRRERPGSGLRSVTLLEDPMDVALPADHPLASKPALTLSELRRPRRRARAPGTSSAPAWPRALSRTSPSSQTTTTPSRAWWPPVWGWRSSRGWPSPGCTAESWCGRSRRRARRARSPLPRCQGPAWRRPPRR
jgi:DNA-binding transcriptional LysR family regulator